MSISFEDGLLSGDKVAPQPSLPATLAAHVSWHEGLRFKLVNWILLQLARRIVDGVADRSKLEFRMVRHAADWADIRRFRLEAYSATIPYMLSVLDADGSDEYDHRSIVFGVWHQNCPVATVRYTPCPFEVMRYLPEDTRYTLFSREYDNGMLEFSRLVVSPFSDMNRLMPALITYSGLLILLNSPYRRCVGYAKPSVVRKLKAFRCFTEYGRFSIPERGSHQYDIILGDFLTGAEQFIEKNFQFAPLVRILKYLLPRK